MATCGFCFTFLDAKHRYSLFNARVPSKDLPVRFSKLLQLPVEEGDGLSAYYCRKCVSRLWSVEKTLEEMISLARSSYSKAGYSETIANSPIARENSRKRVKDTSGETVSPHTTQARPKAKRALGTLGRRLTFNIDSCKGKTQVDYKCINTSNKYKVPVQSCPWQRRWPRWHWTHSPLLKEISSLQRVGKHVNIKMIITIEIHSEVQMSTDLPEVTVSDCSQSPEGVSHQSESSTSALGTFINITWIYHCLYHCHTLSHTVHRECWARERVSSGCNGKT